MKNFFVNVLAAWILGGLIGLGIVGLPTITIDWTYDGQAHRLTVWRVSGERK